MSPQRNLSQNGDTSKCSFSFYGNTSLQSSTNQTQTKDQSMQTDFDLFLDDADKFIDEMDIVSLHGRKFGAR